MKPEHSLLHRGCALSYQVDGDGPPVLFIQGVGVHGAGWRPQIDALASRFRCLCFDNRGMGRSQPLGTRLTIPQMTEDALAILDNEGWESAHIVGHSMGGLIALDLALTAPHRVRSLSLLCTFSKGSDATRLSGRMLWLGIRSRIGTRRQRRNAFLEIVMPPGVLAVADRDALAAEFAPLFGHDLADQPPVAMKQLAAMHSYDASPRLKELAGIPVLVMSAFHDPIARPELGRKMAAEIPGVRYVELADASHGAPIQCADRVNDLLVEQFNSVSR